MLKKRLIFTLLLNENNFVLSRNFNLQSFGDINWLMKQYDFKKISFSVDEIIILDVSRKNRSIENLCNHVKAINKLCFIPISAGGGINNVEDAKKILSSGADKVIINSNLFLNSSLIKKISKIYGSQSIIGSLDIKKVDDNYKFFINNGNDKLENKIEYYHDLLFHNSNIGEIYLNSINKDGTGNGYDLSLLELLPKNITLPIIIAGGAGNFNHLEVGLKSEKINAVATANLFNFIGDGLINARNKLLENNCELVDWNDK